MCRCPFAQRQNPGRQSRKTEIEIKIVTAMAAVPGEQSAQLPVLF